MSVNQHEMEYRRFVAVRKLGMRQVRMKAFVAGPDDAYQFLLGTYVMLASKYLGCLCSVFMAAVEKENKND